MDADLVHATSQRLTQHHAGRAVVAELLELGEAVFALGRHLAHADLVADHLDGLFTLDDLAVGGEKSAKSCQQACREM